MNFLNVRIYSSAISLSAFSKWGGHIGHTIKLKFEINYRRMNGREGTTFDKMANFEKSGLYIQTGLRVNFRKPIFGSKCREP